MRYSYFVLSTMVALTALLFSPAAKCDTILGSAEGFGVLAGSTVTNTGPSTVTGDIGVSPGSAITDYASITHTPPGALHLADAVAVSAQSGLTTAYNGLAGMTPVINLTDQNLGGLTLTSGVYKYNSSAQLTGTLTLDAQGNNDAYWVFQIGSTLTTASSSAVQFTNLGSSGGYYDGLFWQVGSSATLGTSTSFQGNILALTSITLNTGAQMLNGRALARNGAVTMDTNTISNICPNGGPGLSGGLKLEGGQIVPIGFNTSDTPEPASLLLVGLGLVVLKCKRRRTAVR